MAVVAAAAVGGVVAGSLRPIADMAMSLLSNETIQNIYLHDEIEYLADLLSVINGFLDDAERRQSESNVREWLKMLANAANQADDVLDEFLYCAAAARSASKPVKYLASSYWFGCFCNVWMYPSIARRIGDVKGRITAVAEVRNNLGLEVLGGNDASAESSSDARRETGSLMDDEMEVFGRDEKKREIIAKLFGEGDTKLKPPKVSLVPIVGMGGIGKTTLARAVFNDSEVQRRFPNLRKWLFVGKNFDARVLMKKIIEETKDQSLEELQISLRKKVMDEKFLIVLDDVWCEDHAKWQQLWTPLSHGHSGSRVLVTARRINVPSTIHCVLAEPLNVLLEDDCLFIFKKHAFDSGIGIPPENEIVINDAACKIVRKLKGLPLAAKVAGGFLRGASVDTWIETSRLSEMWPMTDDNNDVLPVLRLSYQRLATHLKHCFVFCSVFPKNYDFEKSSLINMWIAHGFIRPAQHKSMDDVGGNYFDELKDRSFFQKIGSIYQMHDLMHDLAQSISMETCLIARGQASDGQGMRATTHLSFYDDLSGETDLGYLSDVVKVRTLIHIRELAVEPFENLPAGLFKRLTCIRVLDLSYSNLRKLPKSIGELKHLRYLNLISTGIPKLPKSFCALYNLQTLRAGENYCRFPKGMSRLINLRHLEADPKYVAKISGIGKLTSLQELKAFNVGKKNGHLISELGNMRQLRQLSVQNLENVDSRKKARQAKMMDKHNLDDLVLEWNQNFTNLRDLRIQEEVLEGLQPRSGLLMLKISNYCGERKPNWMGSLSDLVSLHLHQCRRWKHLPPLGQFIYLRDLEIVWMEELENVGTDFYGGENFIAFPSLKRLVFKDMGKLKTWSGTNQLFPSLLELQIKNCPLLTAIPQLPLALFQLQLVNVGLNSLPGFHGCESTKQRSALSILTVVSCRNLKTISSLLQHDLNLESITTVNCANLESFWEIQIGKVENLKKLVMEDCPELDAFIGEGWINFTSLSSIVMSKCPKLVSLSDDLTRNLKKLDSLEIKSCAKLNLLDFQGLTSLRSLTIHNCPELTSLSENSSTALVSLTLLEITACSSIRGLSVDFLRHLSKLEKLKLKGCNELTRLGFEALHSPTWLTIQNCPKLETIDPNKGDLSLPLALCIKTLETNNVLVINWLLSLNLPSFEQLLIYECPQLTSFNQGGWQHFASLRLLEIAHCKSLISLPGNMRELSSLHELTIIDCPQIDKPPEGDFPFSLNYLRIKGCPKLWKSRNDEGFPDHIFRVLIET